jgi:hypothetical protein
VKWNGCRDVKEELNPFDKGNTSIKISPKSFCRTAAAQTRAPHLIHLALCKINLQIARDALCAQQLSLQEPNCTKQQQTICMLSLNPFQEGTPMDPPYQKTL